MLNSPFQILGDTNQVLQILLTPSDQMYIAGTLIYGSQDIYSRQGENKNILDKWMGKHLSLRKIKNQSNNNEFIGIKRSEGKILVLDVELYGSMYVRQDKVLAIKYQYQPSIRHRKFKEFTLLRKKNVKGESIGFLQGDNNLYVQKCLGAGEKISCQKESVMAMSATVEVLQEGSIITLEGPGFVFLGTSEIMKNQVTYGRIILGIVLIMMIESFLAGFWLDL